MKNVFGIVGWSGSGKTHLICRIIKYLNNKKLNISSIKHSHHNFEVDKKGKDSYEHLRSGSKEVVIYKYSSTNAEDDDKAEEEVSTTKSDFRWDVQTLQMFYHLSLFQ